MLGAHRAQISAQCSDQCSVLRSVLSAQISAPCLQITLTRSMCSMLRSLFPVGPRRGSNVFQKLRRGLPARLHRKLHTRPEARGLGGQAAPDFSIMLIGCA